MSINCIYNDYKRVFGFVYKKQLLKFVYVKTIQVFSFPITIETNSIDTVHHLIATLINALNKI